MATPNIQIGSDINILAGVQQENLIPGSLTVTGAVDVGSLLIAGVPLATTVPAGVTGNVQVNVAGSFGILGAFQPFSVEIGSPCKVYMPSADNADTVDLDCLSNQFFRIMCGDGTNNRGAVTIVTTGSGLNPAVTYGSNNGTITFKTRLTSQTLTLNNGSIKVATAGSGLQVAEGADAKQGVATLIGGTLVVANTSVTANSRIFLTSQDDNGGTPGFLRVSARTASTSFTILSSDVADTSIVAYEIFEPA